MAVEHAPEDKKGFYGSWPQLGAPLGLVLGTLVFSLVSSLLTDAQLFAWGWRLPFTEKLTKLKEQMGKLAVYEKQMLASPDQQISLTDPDSRSMATSGRGSGVVGYNVQVAVDTDHHLIIAHEVTNTGSDRAQLTNVASCAKDVLGVEKLEAVADRGLL
jgi:hypothetical protein